MIIAANFVNHIIAFVEVKMVLNELFKNIISFLIQGKL